MIPFLFFSKASSNKHVSNLIESARMSAKRMALNTEEKEESLEAGFHKYDGVSFVLSRPLTSPTTQDVAGYAIDKDYIAIIPSSKRSMLASQKDVVFVDPDTQSLNELVEIVEKTDDGVLVYKKKEVDQFTVFTEVRMSLSSNPCNVDTSDFTDIKAKCSYPVSANWDEGSHRPIAQPIKGVNEIRAGLGAYASAAVNSELVIKGLTNVKLTAELDIESEFGALIRIDPITWVLKKEFIIGQLNYPLTNPAINFKILGFKFTAELTLDLQFKMSDIKFTMSVPIEYYKGYKFTLHKSIVVTKEGFKQSEWQYSLKQVPSAMSLEEAAKTFINNAMLTFMPSVTIMISATFQCGQTTKTALHLGVTAYIPFEFGASTVKCPAPYLYGSVHPSVDGFVIFDGLTLSGKELLKGDSYTATIYQMKKYEMCLFSPKATMEGNDDIIQKETGSTYVVCPLGLREASPSLGIFAPLSITASSGPVTLGSVSAPMYLVSNPLSSSFNSFLVLDKPPQDTKLLFRLVLGTSQIDLLPARKAAVDIKTMFGTTEATADVDIKETQNVEPFKEFELKRNLVSFKLPKNGNYVHIKPDNNGYHVDQSKFFDETLNNQYTDVSNGEYIMKGCFLKMTLVDIENVGTESNTVSVSIGYGTKNTISSFSFTPVPFNTITAQQAGLSNWNTVITSNKGTVFINSTDKNGRYGNEKRHSEILTLEMLSYTEKKIISITHEDFTFRIMLEPYTPTVIAESSEAGGKSIIARLFVAPVYNGQETTSFVDLSEEEFYGATRFVFSEEIKYSSGKVYAIVNTDGLSPLVECQEIGESSYAIPVESLSSSLTIPFRKSEQKSKYQVRLVALIRDSESGSIMQDNKIIYEAEESNLIYTGAIVNKNSMVKIVNSNGPSSPFKISTTRNIDSMIDVAICSISTKNAQVMIIIQSVNIPEETQRIKIDTTCFKNAIAWGYNDLKLEVTCKRASKVYTTTQEGNSQTFLNKGDSSFIMNVKTPEVLYAYPVCASPSETFCMIEEEFDPESITIVEYKSSEGVESNSTLGEGFKREIITGVKGVAYSKTWTGNLQRLSSIPREGAELKLTKASTSERTEYCFIFGDANIPASRSKYFVNPVEYLSTLGISPVGSDFNVDDIEITDNGCISARNAVVNKEINFPELKKLVDVEDLVTSVLQKPISMDSEPEDSNIGTAEKPALYSSLLYACIAAACIIVVTLIVAGVAVAIRKGRSKDKTAEASELVQSII